ncbi:MAG TPA: hypothetical protein VMW16_11830 [Sedimentisphaerales bacterium]|nr:hypothetical protein [Sedimentisphaerales bacterium]
MTNKNRVCRGVVIVALLLPALSAGQQEQWLGYRSAREAERILGDMSSQNPKLSGDKPAGVELPQFKGDQPLFGKWSSPMAKEGYLWIALDRSHKHGPYDLLYIDSDGDGHLEDETAAAAYQMEENYSSFGPVGIVFEGEDGPISYHLNFRYYGREGRDPYFRVTSGGWYEGAITVGDQKKHCVLIDYNANATFNDKSSDFGNCDRIRISKKRDEGDARFVGNFVQVDEVLYRPEIARDGAYIKLTRAEDVVFGSIRAQDTINEFAAGGENGLLYVALEKGVGKLPVGKYRVHHWQITRKDDKDKSWKLEGRWFDDKTDFEVSEASQTVLQIGEPVVAALDVAIRDDKYQFNKELRGPWGERLDLTCRDARVYGKLHIRNRDGTFDRRYDIRMWDS